MGQTVSLNIHQNDTLTDVNLGSVYLLANNKILLSEKTYHTYHMDNSYYECTFYNYYWECNCASSNYTFSGGSRISPRRGRQLPGGVPTYEFVEFSQKLHEIERIWTRGGEGRASPAPPLDPPLTLFRFCHDSPN